MLILRSAVFNLLFYLLLVAMMVLGLPVLACGRRRVAAWSNLWARASLLLLRVVCGTRVEFRGRDRIPAGALIVAAKHQSFLDIIALVSVFPDFTFVLKRELARIPVFGWYLAASRQVAIDRTRGRAALAKVADEAASVLGEGRRLFIFPEGTRRAPGAEPDYKSGVAFIYAKAGVPCLPVALDSGLFWPRRSFLRRPGTAVIEFLDPLPPGLPRPAFQHALQDRLEAATAVLIAEALAADPALAGPAAL